MTCFPAFIDEFISQSLLSTPWAIATKAVAERLFDVFVNNTFNHTGKSVLEVNQAAPAFSLPKRHGRVQGSRVKDKRLKVKEIRRGHCEPRKRCGNLVN